MDSRNTYFYPTSIENPIFVGPYGKVGRYLHGWAKKNG